MKPSAVFTLTMMCSIACLGLSVPLVAGPPRPSADTAPDRTAAVRAVFQRSCLECHGPARREGGLRLDVDVRAHRSGGRPLIVPGRPDAGELLRRIRLAPGAPGAMPHRGERLTAAEVGAVTEWIRMGAPGLEFGRARHWAFVVPRRPAVPRLSANPRWGRNPIDSFVLARLRREGLTPASEEEPGPLLRRLSLDLIGLPPTPQELDAFLADSRPDRYERAVDRLLASPHFGPRWARHWLDLARYADSHGFQRDDLREIWAYRDWVITALNEDMPYDRFTLEQLAGDLLPDAGLSQRIATGFNRCTTTNVEAGSEPEETRVNQVFDRVNTLGAVWLGVTVECAQCHDHKYDPFTMRDYYRLFAFFNSTEMEADRSNPAVPGSIRFLGPKLELPLPTGEDPAALQAQLLKLETEVRRALERDPQADTAATRRLVRQKTQIENRIKNRTAPTTLVMRELPQPRPTHLFQRGDYRAPGERLNPGFPAAMPASFEGVNRLDLARWLTDPSHPLTARVAVNRWWAELFEAGLVRTPEDFGTRGDRPSHPELLDWLAVELRENGWSMKRLLRLMVTSAAYRQSALSPASRARDPENVLLARGPRKRLDAEMIRDAALSISGLLSIKQGGPPVRPYQPAGLWTKIGGDPLQYEVSTGEDAFRRGIYTVWKRAAPYPSFVNFDAGARLSCVARRPRTNTPLQALTLLNDPVYVEAAGAFARRILAEAPATDSERLHFAFRLATGRGPADGELGVLRSLLEDRRRAYGEAPMNALKVAGTRPLPGGSAAPELAAWHSVATAILNLDETITR